MQILYTKRFVRMLEFLPADIQELFLRQERLFKLNWRDPRLHTKRLHGKPIFFSFRITRNYRLFTFVERDTALFTAVGDRKDMYR
jgi:mRNA-degrading endonuclease RelE of RelBE toxin-antitoxin system